MQSFIVFCLLASASNVFCKNNLRPLTESMGQEVIEIGTPIKELPADMEEEPSIENEEEEHVTTSTVTTTTVKQTTKKETKKPPAITPVVFKKSNVLENTEDEEDRIEKELAVIYKDNVEYKDSLESTVSSVSTVAENTTSSEEPTKPALRSNDRENFKFQPDPFNKVEIERFRTSVDDISCGKKLKAEDQKAPGSSYMIFLNVLVFNVCLFVILLF